MKNKLYVNGPKGRSTIRNECNIYNCQTTISKNEEKVRPWRSDLHAGLATKGSLVRSSSLSDETINRRRSRLHDLAVIGMLKLKTPPKQGNECATFLYSISFIFICTQQCIHTDTFTRTYVYKHIFTIYLLIKYRISQSKSLINEYRQVNYLFLSCTLEQCF